MPSCMNVRVTTLADRKGLAFHRDHEFLPRGPFPSVFPFQVRHAPDTVVFQGNTLGTTELAFDSIEAGNQI